MCRKLSGSDQAPDRLPTYPLELVDHLFALEDRQRMVVPEFKNKVLVAKKEHSSTFREEPVLAFACTEQQSLLVASNFHVSRLCTLIATGKLLEFCCRHL